MASLFASLPFTQAIDALRNRLAVAKSTFLEWDAAARSRAFTMAYVRDTSILESVHDELTQAIAEGKTYADFEKSLRENHLRGWAGTGAWHQRLVYETNLNMAYSAGRVEQGHDSGLRVWRYLPSIADEPRVDHENYYGNLYRMEPGSPVPPIDFNCACGWEWVMPHELEAMGLDPASLPVFNPPTPRSGFVWSPSDYAALEVPSINAAWKLSQVHAGELVAVCGRYGPTTNTPADVAAWVNDATNAAGDLADAKMERITGWMRPLINDGLDLRGLAVQLNEARPVIASNADKELDYLATFATWLRGRVVTLEHMR